jgi:O-antigen/teichoic acid export membrane protein
MGLSTVVGLWFTPFILRHVGPRDFGLWSVGLPVITYVGLIDFGVIAILQRDVAFALGEAEGDIARAVALPDAIGKTQRLVLLQLPVLALASLAVWLWLPKDWAELQGPFAVVLVVFIVTFLPRVNHAILMGLQDLAFLAKLMIANWALNIVVASVMAWRGLGLYALAGSWAVSQLVFSVACYVRVKRRYAEVLPRKVPPLSRDEGKARLRKGFWVLVSQLAVILLNGTDVIVIGMILGPEAVVPYALTDKLVTMLANVPQHLMASAQPALSELRSSPERGRLTNICQALTLSVLIVSGLVTCVVIAVNKGFVIWWIGKADFAGLQVSTWLALSMLFSHWNSALVFGLFAFGYERRISISTVLNGVVAVAATTVLTWWLGLRGGPIGSILGFVLVGIPSSLIAIARETRTTTRAMIASLVPWGWRFALMATTMGVLARYWVPSSIVTLAVTSIGAAALYMVVMFPLLRREPLHTYVLPRLALLQQRLPMFREPKSPGV